MPTMPPGYPPLLLASSRILIPSCLMLMHSWVSKPRNAPGAGGTINHSMAPVLGQSAPSPCPAGRQRALRNRSRGTPTLLV
ncbi:hypothetical protein DAEQUDRAFT_338288 [Daedalea quercina L-15889]|uniref:Uncharacterized protein n=1 Tax=Daedalea quercina L-15889 TaxID=1314783 RepID=A0A165PJJ6_9APHY|nr:hypothetical protein DAEQUDRAFT_338288 [Daedalea quercina L-15889]